jgi:hypothetical protein
MESGIALNLQPERVTVKPVTVYQPAFIPLPHTAKIKKIEAQLAAAIPETALRRK